MKYRFFVFFCLLSCVSYGQNHSYKLGAYYFDGWTGHYPYHITNSLLTEFKNREPVWGWMTSHQDILDKQIKLASSVGLSFFTFCWYNDALNNFKNEPLNNALKLYMSSKYRSSLDYSLLIVNSSEFKINKKNWSIVTDEWISNFKRKNYLLIDGKPVIFFYSLSNLIMEMGSSEELQRALLEFRNNAVKSGFKSILISVCVEPNLNELRLAEQCGFDFLTGYNYHNYGLKHGIYKVPIDSMIVSETKIWNSFKTLSNLKYLPTVTLNWDPRPWANTNNGYSRAPYFVGFNRQSVKRSFDGLFNWLDNNESNTFKEKIGLIYAWNEMGEGAYLVPTKDNAENIQGLVDALKLKK